MDSRWKYENILCILCSYKNINRENIINYMQDIEFKNLVFLMLFKYKALNYKEAYKELGIKSERSLKYQCKKAYEKYLCDVRIRSSFFLLENYIQKSKKTLDLYQHI